MSITCTRKLLWKIVVCNLRDCAWAIDVGLSSSDRDFILVFEFYFSIVLDCCPIYSTEVPSHAWILWLKCTDFVTESAGIGIFSVRTVGSSCCLCLQLFGFRITFWNAIVMLSAKLCYTPHKRNMKHVIDTNRQPSWMTKILGWWAS